MNRGKWYIAFTWDNDFEPHGGVTEYEKIFLNVTTEEEAVALAPARLKEWIAEAKADWEKLGKTWFEPKPGSKYAPHHYSVIYECEIPIQ